MNISDSTPSHILVIGSGGREHAIVACLKRTSPHARITCSPGNGGIASDVTCITLATHHDIIAYCQNHGVDLVVIGPEQPLVEGLADQLRAAGIATFGPSAVTAQLEGSKAFTKALCDRYAIPTAAYATFDNKAEALAYLATHPAPIVIKADGLAAGKGVTVAMDNDAATRAVQECFSGAFGKAGSRVVIEEFLEGEEISFFALCDGTNALAFASAQDHKRAFDGDTGPNTGGMGTYSPAPIFTEAHEREVMEKMILPTLRGLASEGTPYIGVLFAGLMLTRSGIKLIEYNCRFGDPETQVMLSRFEGDLAALLYSCAIGKIDATTHRLSNHHALCVVMATRGYPASVTNGSIIHGLDTAASLPDVTIYHAATARDGDNIIANGGRVLGVTGTGESLQTARTGAYHAVESIDWKEGFYRSDIGWRAL
jgi:phosphoribosylamine---glycine ligase